ncbi:MAG: CBS domain-containing protein [Candidatus Delongbacteria bacterium]|nr:CBS domain-containing protein [Candidatus Delongbacteria bacterium]
MKLCNLISQELTIWDDPHITDHDMLFKKAADLISLEFGLDKEEIKEAFHKRYELGYEVFPGATAIPHGRIDGFDDLIIVIAKTQNPIKFGNGEASYFFIILTSNTGSNMYLKSVAGLLNIISKNVDQFPIIKHREEIFKIIEISDIRLNEQVKVSEIMSKDVITVTPEDKISDVVNKMKEYQLKFFPVADENNKYLGKIDLLDILDIAYPSYLFNMNNLSFLNNLKTFEEFINKESTFLVQDIFKKDTKKVIRSDSSIIELGFILKKEKWHHLTVLDESKTIVGIVSMYDILTKIIRA